MKRYFFLVGVAILLTSMGAVYFQFRSPVLNDVSNMPKFTEKLTNVSDYLYHIKFDESYYPCKLEEDGSLLPHPLYGYYVIKDYIGQYEKTGEDSYLAAAIIVADSSINKMRKRKNALCFYYPKGFMNYSAFYKEMYSGLTQMSYAEIFYKLYSITLNEKYLNASNQCFNSLTIPIDEGGVFWNVEGNSFISEYPFEVPDLVLNGELCIAISLRNYGEMNLKRKDECEYLFNCQIDTIKNYIELFDIPSIHTSRYMLSGPMCFQINTTVSDIKFGDCIVSIPNIGERKILRKKSSETTRYDSYIFDDELIANGLKLNIMVSRISYPKENTISLQYFSNETGSISFYAYVPELSPKWVDGINPQYTLIGKYDVEKGEGEIIIPIRWINEYVFGNPCVFNYIGAGGLYYNSYHYAHIDYFKKIYEYTGDEIFKEYADKWEEYINHWYEDKIWNSNEISFEKYH